jgi:transposase, IS30 family
MGRPPIPRAQVRAFWAALSTSGSPEQAAARVGVSASAGRRWITDAGGVAPDLAPPSGRYLSLAEREQIDLGLADGLSQAEIARRLGRARSTISRELRRHSHPPRRVDGPRHYRASTAHAAAEHAAQRPKPTRLAQRRELTRWVQTGLEQRWSPRKISGRLRRQFPDRPEMQVSHETIYKAIYKALFVQGRGELRRELHRCLRTGRAVRRPRRQTGQRGSRIQHKVMISDRPADVADRAVPGHWEGDLILGKNGASAIGTLVERATRFVMLLHLPDGRDAEQVRDAMLATLPSLPTAVRRSLTWDQGVEMARHRDITMALDLPIYFCDPHSPWQRGSNENTNGLLRDYFPKGSDLSVHTAADLAAVADQLNGRPRDTLDFETPAEAMTRLLSAPPTTGVASIP